MEIVADSSHLFLVYEKVRGLGSDDDISLHSERMEVFHLRIDRGCADASGYEDIMLPGEFFCCLPDKVRRVPERPRDIRKSVPHFQRADFARGDSDSLGHYCHSAGLCIIVTDCQGDSFPVGLGNHYQELPGAS